MKVPNFEQTNMNNYVSKPINERHMMKELNLKFKAMILSRIQDKQSYIDMHSINNLMMDIMRTKIAIEVELEDISTLNHLSNAQNAVSSKDATK